MSLASIFHCLLVLCRLAHVQWSCHAAVNYTWSPTSVTTTMNHHRTILQIMMMHAMITMMIIVIIPKLIKSTLYAMMNTQWKRWPMSILSFCWPTKGKELFQWTSRAMKKYCRKEVVMFRGERMMLGCLPCPLCICAWWLRIGWTTWWYMKVVGLSKPLKILWNPGKI